jgi:hypothetical protein
VQHEQHLGLQGEEDETEGEGGCDEVQHEDFVVWNSFFCVCSLNCI